MKHTPDNEPMPIYSKDNSGAIHMTTPDNETHLENHAIALEMLHTLAEYNGVYFQPKEDGSYEMKKIKDKNTPDNVGEVVEDFKQRQTLVEPNGFLADVGEDYDAVDFNMEVMEDWLKQALTKAHTGGAKEERERIREWVLDSGDFDGHRGADRIVVCQEELLQTLTPKQLTNN